MSKINSLGANSGSREPSPSGLGPTGFDPGRGTVYVIIGSSGEYSDRYEKVIGYVLTEDEAREAVERAEREKAKGLRPPHPSDEKTHAMLGPDGDWFTGYILDAPRDYRFEALPDAAEIETRNKAALARWESECRSFSLIDPLGPMDSYYYEAAPAIAMEARQGLDRATGLDGEAATARASPEASPNPSDPRDPDNG